MNYMEQVAQMLGVEIGEIFYIKNSYYKYRLTEKSIEFYDGLNQQWNICPYRILDLLNGDDEIIKKLILDDIEKEYLSGVIKPFRDKVTGVIKWGKEIGKGLEYIVVIFTDDCKESGMSFPRFKEGTMYKGMEPNKEYTLEELGL